MHTSGKVLAWFVVLGAAGAIFLSAKTLAIRNAWMQKAQQNEEAFLKNQELLVVKTREYDNKLSELSRTMLGWDRYWPEVESRLNRDGSLQLGLGTTNGVQPEQVFFIFGLNPDGSSRYVGDFKVVGKLTETTCLAKPNWFQHAGDLTPGTFKVRVRTLIPNQYQARLAALEQQILAVEQSVLTNQSELEREGQLTEQTEKLIAARLTEINGDPALEGKTLPPVNVKGLIAAMADEEEARNAALVRIDQLLRDLKKTREKFIETLKINRQLTESLPRPVPSEATVGAAGR
jgi:hypothetical protein